MRTNVQGRKARRAQSAFSLIQVMVAAALAGMMFLIGMTGLSTSFQIVGSDRENARAIQILLEKSELLRLYSWNQVTNGDATTYIPTTFTAPFYSGTNVNSTNIGGFNYSGTVTITNAPITESYSNDIRQVTISLTWTGASSARVTHSRSLTTYVSRYGIQNYVY